MKSKSYSKLGVLPILSQSSATKSTILLCDLEELIIKTMKLFGFNITKQTLLKILLVLFAALITYFWLDFAPPGLLGKMDAVGYAVCHRIDERSFQLGERALPLCARCSGMQLGALLGLFYQSLWGRRGKFPPLKILIFLGALALFFVVDGVNSYLNFVPFIPSVYPSQNWLRLVSGTGLGLGMAAVIYPIFNQTIWKNWIDEPAIAGWKQFSGLFGLAILLDLSILSENPLVLYPLAVLSGLAVLVVLSICYSLLIVMIIKKDNHYLSWRSAWVPLLAGFVVAITQTFVIDLVRFAFTGTWGGFNL